MLYIYNILMTEISVLVTLAGFYNIAIIAIIDHIFLVQHGIVIMEYLLNVG